MNRFTGWLPSVMSVERSPNDCSSLTCRMIGYHYVKYEGEGMHISVKLHMWACIYKHMCTHTHTHKHTHTHTHTHTQHTHTMYIHTYVPASQGQRLL